MDYMENFKLWINVFTILQIFQQNQPAALLWHLLKSRFNFLFFNVNQPTILLSRLFNFFKYNPTPDIVTCFINTSCILQSSFHYNRVLFLCTWLVAALQYTHRMPSSLAINLVLFTGGSDYLCWIKWSAGYCTALHAVVSKQQPSL